ncbi:MAG: hypothetical protein JWN60_2338 [Acidobacteria bacterium]|jgi:hypothetical protein|nr:hypothetical protein [Acidobacteriota bacterium]
METSKPYTIKLEDRGKYLYALVGGEKLTPEIAGAYWREIAGACFELEKNKIMIEKDFVESVSPLEMVHMGTYLGELLATRQIAFLDRYGNDDINELGKKIARNRDVKMQIFKNAADAEKWLLAG